MGQKATVELALDLKVQRGSPSSGEVLDYRDYYTDTNLAVLVPEEGIASPSTDAYCRQNCRQSRYTALGGP